MRSGTFSSAERDLSPIRILFNTWANRDDVNSQSLTARAIASRLDPDRFTASLFLGWNKTPDPELVERSNTRLLQVPPRLGSLSIARELLWGAHDIVFYPSINGRASRLFHRLRPFSGHRKVIDCVETSLDQIEACPDSVQRSIFASLGRADLRSAITPAISRDLKKRYGLDSSVIPLGVDLELFQPVDRAGQGPPWRILYVASIQERKQPHLILELARRLRGMPVEFHLIGPTLGDPAYLQQLLQEKKRDGLDQVVFRGAMSQSDIQREMQQSTLYVLPSRLEGFGKTTLEAAATGLPAVVFDDYETTTVVHNKTGFQVKTFDEMVAAVERLLADRALRSQLGEASVRHARRFTWDHTARQWEKVFSKLAS